MYRHTQTHTNLLTYSTNAHLQAKAKACRFHARPAVVTPHKPQADLEGRKVVKGKVSVKEISALFARADLDGQRHLGSQESYQEILCTVPVLEQKEAHDRHKEHAKLRNEHFDECPVTE